MHIHLLIIMGIVLGTLLAQWVAFKYASEQFFDLNVLIVFNSILCILSFYVFSYLVNTLLNYRFPKYAFVIGFSYGVFTVLVGENIKRIDIFSKLGSGLSVAIILIIAFLLTFAVDSSLSRIKFR